MSSVTEPLPSAQLSEREQWALDHAVLGLLTPGERMEMLDFLGYPNRLPNTQRLRVNAVVARIMQARARGEHIA